MINNKKLMGLVLVLLIGLVGLTALVSADSDVYQITKVEVDGITVYEDEDADGVPEIDEGDVTVGLEAGESIDVEIEVYGSADEEGSTCDADADDDDNNSCVVEVKAKAWIGGYEYDDVEDTSSTFDVEPGVTYTKRLTLEIPEDIDVGDEDDSENEYTLYVEVYDDQDDERISLDTSIERARHNLNIQDVVFDSSVDAGDSLNVEVRVENLGEEKEEDIRVEVEIVDVDSDVDYIDELASFEIRDEDEESSDSAYLTLSLDDDLASDYYDVLVTISYDRGHETVEETHTLWVSGVEADEEEDEVEEEADVSVSLSSTDLDASAGEASSFTLTFANAGGASETYTVSVSGESQWAASDVSPSTVVVSSGETEEVVVTVTPEAGAEGSYDFTVQILDGDGSLEQEIEMSADVAAASSGAFSDTSSALKVAFIILIVLIIIVGLIVAFRRLNDEDDDDPLEPKDGQTYY